MKISVKDNPKVAIYSRVWVDGVEVSARCYEADDVAGYALCYVHGERTEEEIAAGVSKFKMIDKTEYGVLKTDLMVERLEGNVRIETGR